MELSTDSNFGAFLDTRRSVSGAVVILVKRAVSKHSRKQTVTASGRVVQRRSMWPYQTQ